MTLKLDRKEGHYKVSDVILEHNHKLHLPKTFHLLVSHRKISDLQAFEIETADDAGIGPKVAHELASHQVGGPLNLSYTLRDHKNYLRTKRQQEMAYGQAGSMLKYFQDKIAENPSFQYALQMDCEEQITNIFRADAKMIWTMHTLVVMLVLTLLLELTRRAGLLVCLSDSTILEKL